MPTPPDKALLKAAIDLDEAGLKRALKRGTDPNASFRPPQLQQGRLEAAGHGWPQPGKPPADEAHGRNEARKKLASRRARPSSRSYG